MSARRLDTALLIAALGYVAVGIAVALASAWPIYDVPRLVLVAVTGFVLGAGLAAVARRLRWAWWSDAWLVVVAFVISVVPVAIPSALTSIPRAVVALRDGIFGVITGWKQIVTLELPLGDYQAVLVPFYVVVLATSYAAVRIGSSRRPWAFVAVPIMFAAYGFGIAFGAETIGAIVRMPLTGVEVPGGRLVVLALVLLLASLGWLVLRGRLLRSAALARAAAIATSSVVTSRSTWGRIRRGSIGVVMVFVALVIGVAVARPVAEAADRQSIRAVVDPVVVLSSFESPLASYRAWFDADHFDAEILRVSGATDVDRIRFATLDEYDGVRFQVGARAADAFRRLANPNPLPGSDTVDLIVSGEIGGAWVPLPGVVVTSPVFTGERADELADSVYVASDGSTAIAVPGGDAPGLRAGDSYRASGTPMAGLDAILGVQGGNSRIDQGLYPELAAWVDAQDLPRDGTGLVEAITRLRERGYLSHALTEDAAAARWIAALEADGGYAFEPSLAGHSVSRIESLFGDLNERAETATGSLDDLVAAVGDDEQFATAAALVARYLGFESRVVVGVRLEGDDDGIPACREGVCTGSNVSAWVEVATGSGEWVAIDVTPQHTTPLGELPSGEILPEHPTVPDEVDDEVREPPVNTTADVEASPAESDDPEPIETVVVPILRVVGYASVALLSLLAPLLTVFAAKVIRRAQRRRGEPEVAIVAAWDELVDESVDLGVLHEEVGTRRETAARIGGPHATKLADVVDRAVFGATVPTEAERTEAWRLVEMQSDALRASVSSGQRLRAAVRPMSFLRRLRSPRPIQRVKESRD